MQWGPDILTPYAPYTFFTLHKWHRRGVVMVTWQIISVSTWQKFSVECFTAVGSDNCCNISKTGTQVQKTGYLYTG